MVVKDLKIILHNNLNKWISIEFFSQSGVVGEVVGVLREFTDSYLMIENISKNYINTKAVTIAKITIAKIET